MLSLEPEQILVISVVSLWFLLPLGMLVSFIKQSNEEHAPKVTQKFTANEIAHSPAYAPDEEDDEDEFEPTPISAYQIPKDASKSDHHQPRV